MYRDKGDVGLRRMELSPRRTAGAGKLTGCGVKDANKVGFEVPVLATPRAPGPRVTVRRSAPVAPSGTVLSARASSSACFTAKPKTSQALRRRRKCCVRKTMWPSITREVSNAPSPRSNPRSVRSNGTTVSRDETVWLRRIKGMAQTCIDEGNFQADLAPALSGSPPDGIAPQRPGVQHETRP